MNADRLKAGLECGSYSPISTEGTVYDEAVPKGKPSRLCRFPVESVTHGLFPSVGGEQESSLKPENSKLFVFPLAP